MSRSRNALRPLVFLAIAAAAAPASFAAEWFVDNRLGDDAMDGQSRLVVSEFNGPTFSISRALGRSKSGDTIHVANQGIPYYESLQVVGPRFSSRGSGALTIEGNGAIISGARPVPVEEWKSLGNDVWRFTPFRKGFFQLIQQGQALPEVACLPNAPRLPDLPPGHWCAWRGSIYYRTPPGGLSTPRDVPLEFAGDEVGVTLLDAHSVVLRNLELRHFRLDGVNVHDRCDSVFLENLRLVQNGRAGLAVGGTAKVRIVESILEDNRRADLLNTELGRVEAYSCQIGTGDAGALRIKGRRVFIEGREFVPPSR